MARFTRATHLCRKKTNKAVAVIDPVTWMNAKSSVLWVACVKQAMTVEGEESELWLPSTLRNN
jgi:hypothetical protein